jgi:regulator of protease activity HflC (stomatin/prohibitin superfamily)
MTGIGQYSTVPALVTLLKLSATIAWWLLAIYSILTFVIILRRYGMYVACMRLLSYQVLLPLLLVVCLNLLSASLVFVLPQQAAVVISVVSSGGIRPQPLRAGLYWIIPILERDAHYPISWQTYTMASTPTEGARLGDDSIRARTKDGQEVRLDSSIIFRIDMERTVSIHIDWQDRYVEDLVRPIIRGFVRTQVSQFSVQEVNSNARKDLEALLDRLLREKLAEHGFIVSQFLLRDITFSDEYAAAIEHKQVALEGQEQKKHEAQQLRNQAEGQADAARTQAAGQADAIKVVAQAEAEALEAIGKVLVQNKDLLTFRYIDKLSPNIRAMLLPSNAPLILPLPQFKEMDRETGGGTEQPALPPGPTPPTTTPGQPR